MNWLADVVANLRPHDCSFDRFSVREAIYNRALPYAEFCDQWSRVRSLRTFIADKNLSCENIIAFLTLLVEFHCPQTRLLTPTTLERLTHKFVLLFHDDVDILRVALSLLFSEYVCIETIKMGLLIKANKSDNFLIALDPSSISSLFCDMDIPISTQRYVFQISSSQ